MIRQWEILQYPSVSDPDRHRLSLWSDGGDVERVRSVFPQRTGVVWIPRRKPYNCAFFLYGLSSGEKSSLEDMLSGKAVFPESRGTVAREGSVKGRKLTEEDTQEVIKYDIVADERDSVSTGLGKTSGGGNSRLGYYVPDYLRDAGDRVHEILERTLYEKKVSAGFEKAFVLAYPSLSLVEIHRLIRRCRDESVRQVIAVGEPVHMQALKKIANDSGIYVKLISESVIDRNLWLTVIAELLSFE